MPVTPALVARARAGDHDRYLAALFAPVRHRDALLALIAFNHEVARIPEVVSEPMLGQIRLQWWRETIDAIYGETEVRRHDVALALAEAIRRYRLAREPFDRLLDAREQDLADTPPADLDALVRYAGDTAGGLCALMIAVLGGRGDAAQAAAREVGTAWALIGLLRAAAFHAAGGRLYFPGNLLRAAGVTPASVLSGAAFAALAPAAEPVAARASALLEAARAHRKAMPRRVRAGLLLAPLGDLYLTRLRRARFDPRDPGLAVGPLRRQALLAAYRLRGTF